MNKRVRGGMGRGLDSLFTPAAPASGVREVPVGSIRQNPRQPRTYFDESALDDLAASIREHGIIQPLIVSKHSEDEYELIAGERRIALALDEQPRHDPAGTALAARREGEGWVLEGEKVFVVDSFGVVIRIDPADGHEVKRVETGLSLQQPAVAVGEQLLLSTLAGELGLIPQP